MSQEVCDSTLVPLISSLVSVASPRPSTSWKGRVFHKLLAVSLYNLDKAEGEKCTMSPNPRTREHTVGMEGFRTYSNVTENDGSPE